MKALFCRQVKVNAGARQIGGGWREVVLAEAASIPQNGIELASTFADLQKLMVC